MKPVALFFIATASIFASYDGVRSITIDHTRTGGSDATDFPLLVSGDYSFLAAAANGGKVRNTATCANGNSTCPLDLVFGADSGCNTTLSWEVESYAPATGKFVAWVRIPNVSHITDTIIYICYGDTAIHSFQGGATGAAWAGFRLVGHLGNGTALDLSDSSGTGNTVIQSSVTAGSGKIGGSGGLAGNSSSYLAVPNTGSLDSTFGTWSVWFNTTQSVAGGYPVIMTRADAAGSGNGITMFLEAGTARLRVQFGGVADLAGSGGLNDGAWHHAALSFTGTGTARLYVDGAQVASASPYLGWNFNGQPFRAGVALDSFWAQWSGALDELELSSLARSADWILATYNNQNDPSAFYIMGQDLIQPAGQARGGSQPIIGLE